MAMPSSIVYITLLLCCLHAIPAHARRFRHHKSKEYPCEYIDTINITNTHILSGSFYTPHITNSSFSHNIGTQNDLINVPIPRELVAVYDFIIENGVRIAAPRHQRACICTLKPCLRFCCSPGLVFDTTNQLCAPSTFNFNSLLGGNRFDQRSMVIQQANGALATVQTDQHFIVQTGTPCQNVTLLKRDEKIVSWIVYDNGTIGHNNKLATKHYCLTPYQVESNWEWQPLVCDTPRLGFYEYFYIVCLILAIFCMIIVMIAYLGCEEIRSSFYGVAINGYCIVVIITYSLLISLVIADPEKMSGCLTIPIATLLFWIWSFVMLLKIAIFLCKQHYEYKINSCIECLISVLLLIFPIGWAIFAGKSNYDGYPVLGGDYCWFDPNSYAVLWYFLTPSVIIIVLAVIFLYSGYLKLRSYLPSNNNPSSVIAIEYNRVKSFRLLLVAAFWSAVMWSICFSLGKKTDSTKLNLGLGLTVFIHGCFCVYGLIKKNNQIMEFYDEDSKKTTNADGSSVPMQTH